MKRAFVRLVSVAALLGVAAGVVACSPQAPAGGAVQASEQTSDESRLVASEADQAAVPQLVEGNSQFAFELYQMLRGQGGNLFYSPYSISLALAMTYAGARGVTEQEMAAVLHLPEGQQGTQRAFNALQQALDRREEHPDIKEESRFRLSIVNALWGQNDFAFLASFLDELARYYGAGMRTLDFVTAPDQSRRAINQWVEDETEQKIKDLLPPGAIDSDTRLVLSNAIYFNAAWMYPFEESATRQAPFQLLGGTAVSVPMMQQSERLGYAEGGGYQAVELTYLGGETSMVILLPADGEFEPFARSLDAQRLQSIIQDMDRREVLLSLPKFEYEASFALKDVLVQQGMENAFSDHADFSGMTGGRDLFISEVYHKAFVAVDEEGTEAAAATAVVMTLTAAPGMPTEVLVDRAFIFVIRDVETGTILFVGQVLDPTA